MALGVASGQYSLPWAIMTNLGHIIGPLWKHPFIITIIHYTALVKKFHTVNPKKNLSMCNIRREGFHCKIVNKLVYFWRKLFLLLNYRIFGHIGLPNVSLPHYLLDCRQLCINKSHFSWFCRADDEISVSSWIGHDYLYMKFE